MDHLAGLLGIRGGGRLSTARVLCVGLGRGGGNLQQLLAAALVAMPHRGRDERVLLVLAADGGAQLASDGGREAVAGEQVVPQQLRARRPRLGIQAQTQLQSPINVVQSTDCRSQPSSTHSTSSTSTSLRAAVDPSHQRSTGSTTQRPLVTERRVFIPSVRRPENDQGCNLKLKAAVVNGYS